MNKLRNVTLEMSLKPFRSIADDAIEAVCREAFRQWAPLLHHARQASVLLWTADGSEILTYQGDLDQPIEWARYIGGANPKLKVPGDPEGKCLHSRAYLYTDDPPVIAYRDLARIVRVLKRVGAQMTGLPVRVGETFDPGCEFARSPFKYELHNEICLADTGGPKSFACCYATLNADRARYAGFPDGIPQDTPLGTFLGRQCQHLLTDLGFDYVWFSNGFGFGLETWMTRGPMFDGQAFNSAPAAEIRRKILDFWRRFRDECPRFPIETRGTNLSTGIDLASDAVPLRDIYAGGFSVEPPPNSPWAAINGDFGIELAGYMSHIAELPPDSGYPFRFYTHDPWWHNSPWLDRYGREPHDIYLPLSVARIDAAGRIQNPDSVLFLTIDDSYGRMPEQVPLEVLPHVFEGLRHAPDSPGPTVWVYPFDEYHDLTFGAQARIDEPFFGDWFIRSAIRNGFPLNTVVSSRNFLATLARDSSLYRESVLVTPVPSGDTDLSRALVGYVRQGGKVLLYGPVRHAGRQMLGVANLRVAEAIAGTLSLALHASPDVLTGTPYPSRVEHRELMCAGGIEAVLHAPGDAHTTILATASSPALGQQRVAALVRRDPAWNGGALAWVRGTNASCYLAGDLISGAGHLPTPDDASTVFHGDLLARFALAALGCSVAVCKRGPAQPNPITCAARHDNGFFFSGYVPDTTVELRLRFPQGAPVFIGCDAELVGGAACYRLPRAWRRECRVFVEQAAGVVSCFEKTAEMIGLERRLRVTGLDDATVRVYAPRRQRQVTLAANGSYPYFEGPFVEYQACDGPLGRHLLAEHVSGELVVSW